MEKAEQFAGKAPPLNQAEHLRYLDVRENPVSNSIEAGEDVVILR